jgi:hypothetical protein
LVPPSGVQNPPGSETLARPRTQLQSSAPTAVHKRSMDQYIHSALLQLALKRANTPFRATMKATCRGIHPTCNYAPPGKRLAGCKMTNYNSSITIMVVPHPFSKHHILSYTKYKASYTTSANPVPPPIQNRWITKQSERSQNRQFTRSMQEQPLSGPYHCNTPI